MDDDERYMRMALELAKNAEGRTSPNPMVGAVIVKDGRVVGCGWHRKAGTPHAEVHALAAAGELAKGAVIYVSLEPCSHFGRTPPCCDALIKAGIKRAVIAMEDTNPKVSGRGIKRMRAAGIEVVTGILANEARKLNEVFFKWIEKKMPFVTIKSAMTLDGKTATCTGQSKWITSEQSRQYGHRLRDINDAIIVGVNTVIADNPSLTTRLGENGKNPLRVVVDSCGRIPLDSKLLNDGEAPVLLAVTVKAPKERLKALADKNVQLIETKADANGRVCLPELFMKLAQQDICSVLVEGGATLMGSIIKEKLADKAYFFIAPKLVGGEKAKSAVAGEGIGNLSDAAQLTEVFTDILDGGDILVKGYLR
ncbi:bifunctional diaminohydroxyphosphoribosylaminopyrimidine deaminase/5-amino-6-(5-phosphoribosylamino)uracil reductase RibD [Pectinatus cerevisiiphilus]|uniref:Riboflavin biosynthesis protein RibD n=1 Tax=Pectinatus cerevisiiphilus TaxID=86956 RepID=A0A4R3KDT9_9FIRM|nr:bifunctional diaminohydroxyphosphoribosylaminopyrimidine deaminase/5-amino-6-(5-phosphoribosylamino)uracil reductase RibD [Pectinatus cerevisiiphilus]TCS81367.1 diaminohydroxyphosphoribosylaminopyrimidine deaminase [Pectinatus cerevisiiphilus]